MKFEKYANDNLNLIMDIKNRENYILRNDEVIVGYGSIIENTNNGEICGYNNRSNCIIIGYSDNYGWPPEVLYPITDIIIKKQRSYLHFSASEVLKLIEGTK